MLSSTRITKRSQPRDLLALRWPGSPAVPLLAAAALAVHALPALTTLGPGRRRLLQPLSGVGRPGSFGLTFDDGPHPLGTPAVLDALGELGWKATFFMLGSQVAAHPDVAQRVAAAGHEIAVHGYGHRNHLARTPRAVARDVRKAADLIGAVTCTRPAWYRPPYGVLSAGTLVAARSCGLTPVLWTAWGCDWVRTTPPDVARMVIRDLRDGGTVLLHDSDCTSVPGSWRSTVAALPLLAEHAQAAGLKARPLSVHLAGR